MIALAIWLPAFVTGQPSGPPEPAIGAEAPAFANAADNGQTYSRDSLRGKWVVLEWYSPSCPYARQHYESGAMPRLQREWTDKGVVWLTISSSARLEGAVAFARSKGTAATAILDDLEAKTARAYQAKATPHLFVIDPKGILVYRGAVDDRPDGPGDAGPRGPGRNFVSDALTSAMAGRPVETPVTTPYGCAVHFGQ
jgi:peroxiredoxin